MEINKIKTYLNFAIRSRNIAFGVDDILKSRNIEVVIFSDLLAETSRNKLNNFATKKQICILQVSGDEMKELLQNESVKAVGVTDKNLAKAIRMNFTNIVSNGGNLE